MVQASKRRHGGSRDRAVQHLLPEDWPVYLAVLPAVVASAAIGLTGLLALGTAGSSHQRWALNASPAKETPTSDGYMEGLVKLGIVELPRSTHPRVADPGSHGGPLPITHLARGCVRLG